jgi:transcriptional regulator with XRE-family HTH domain
MTGQELKNLREKAGLKQVDLAQLVGMHKNTIYGYENSEMVPEKKAPILQNALEEVITKKGLSAENGEEEPIYNKNGNGFIQRSDGTFDIKIELIPFEAFASYLESVEAGTVEQDFETTSFNVDKYGSGNYKAFRIKGDSMNGGLIDDTKDGAKVLGRELGRHHWKDGFYPTEYGWIILSKQNIFHKDIIDYDPNTGNITCHSRNPSPEYGDFKLNLNDVYQIFKVIKRTF